METEQPLSKMRRFIRSVQSRLIPANDGSPSTTEPPAPDVEAPLEPHSTSNRFTYDPQSILERLLVSIRIKNKLDTSKIVRIPYRTRYKYLLLLFLALITAFLTPSLLPSWIGFEWATPRDMCQSPSDKLQTLRQHVENISSYGPAVRYLAVQKFRLHCMNYTAARFYHGRLGKPPRFQWPHECNSEIAKVSLREEQCHSQQGNVCHAIGGVLGFFASIGGNCVREIGPEVCVETTNVDRADALLELEQIRSKPPTVRNVTLEDEPIVATANEKIQKIIHRLITQIDLASDAFIVYSFIAIAVGVPLIIYRREKGSMVVGAAFGLTKVWFVITFIVMLTLYDSASLVLRETNFDVLFQNFLRDPCYVDPVFSSQRVAMIADVCSKMASISAESEVVLHRMDNLYYDTRLFGYCRDEARPFNVHPKLEEFDKMRSQYRLGNISNPGVCNATELNEVTSVAPSDKSERKWKAVFGSGVLAQLLLKFVLSSWVVQLFAFVEPMVLHNGKVEIWGPFEKSERLSEGEEGAVVRFARDKHLLSLLFFSILMALEVALIAYSISTTVGGADHIEIKNELQPVSPDEYFEVICPSSLFLDS